jgi:hypothetical protein
VVVRASVLAFLLALGLALMRASVLASEWESVTVSASKQE